MCVGGGGEGGGSFRDLVKARNEESFSKPTTVIELDSPSVFAVKTVSSTFF